MFKLKLRSPVGAEPAIFQWPLSQTDGKTVSNEIIQTIRWVCEDLPELKLAFKYHSLENVNTSSYDEVKTLCDRYNKAVDGLIRLIKGTTQLERIHKRPSAGLLRHIMTQCYKRAVLDPKNLTLFDEGTSDVYGETSFDAVDHIVKSLKLTEDDVFIDLGSGVGQVVLQVAAASECKVCYGIERVEWPAKYALSMSDEFQRWMGWYGKLYSDYLLDTGDFLDDQFSERINSASVVFVHNTAFESSVDNELKKHFSKLRQGARIVSTKPYCSNSSSNSSFISVEQLSIPPRPSGVTLTSFEDTLPTFYVHTVDHTMAPATAKNSNSRESEERSFTVSEHRSLVTSEDEGSQAALSSDEASTAPGDSARATMGANVAAVTERRRRHRPRHRRRIKQLISDDEDEETAAEEETGEMEDGEDEDEEAGSRSHMMGGRAVRDQGKHIDLDISYADDSVGDSSNSNVKADVGASARRVGVQLFSPSHSQGQHHQGQVGRGRRCAKDAALKRNKRLLNQETNHSQVATGSKRSTPTSHLPGAKRPKVKVSAAAMDALDCFHRETLLTTSRDGYLPPDSFNDPFMVQHSSGGPGMANGLTEHRLFSPRTRTQSDVDISNINGSSSAVVKSDAIISNGNLAASHLLRSSIGDESEVLSGATAMPAVVKEEDRLAASRIDSLVDEYKTMFTSFMKYMGTAKYRVQLEMEVRAERKRNKDLMDRVQHLEQQIQRLQHDGSASLSACLQQLGVNAGSPVELLVQMQQMVGQCDSLKQHADHLQQVIHQLDRDKASLARQQRLRATSLAAAGGDVSGADAVDHLLDEARQSLVQHRRLIERQQRIVSSFEQCGLAGQGQGLGGRGLVVDNCDREMPVLEAEDGGDSLPPRHLPPASVSPSEDRQSMTLGDLAAGDNCDMAGVKVTDISASEVTRKDSPTSSRWQAQISSDFDALLGFASTELVRRRRSVDAVGRSPVAPATGTADGSSCGGPPSVGSRLSTHAEDNNSAALGSNMIENNNSNANASLLLSTAESNVLTASVRSSDSHDSGLGREPEDQDVHHHHDNALRSVLAAALRRDSLSDKPRTSGVADLLVSSKSSSQSLAGLVEAEKRRLSQQKDVGYSSTVVGGGGGALTSPVLTERASHQQSSLLPFMSATRLPASAPSPNITAATAASGQPKNSSSSSSSAVEALLSLSSGCGSGSLGYEHSRDSNTSTSAPIASQFVSNRDQVGVTTTTEPNPQQQQQAPLLPLPASEHHQFAPSRHYKKKYYVNEQQQQQQQQLQPQVSNNFNNSPAIGRNNSNVGNSSSLLQLTPNVSAGGHMTNANSSMFSEQSEPTGVGHLGQHQQQQSGRLHHMGQQYAAHQQQQQQQQHGSNEQPWPFNQQHQQQQQLSAERAHNAHHNSRQHQQQHLNGFQSPPALDAAAMAANYRHLVMSGGGGGYRPQTSPHASSSGGSNNSSAAMATAPPTSNSYRGGGGGGYHPMDGRAVGQIQNGGGGGLPFGRLPVPFMSPTNEMSMSGLRPPQHAHQHQQRLPNAANSQQHSLFLQQQQQHMQHQRPTHYLHPHPHHSQQQLPQQQLPQQQQQHLPRGHRNQ